MFRARDAAKRDALAYEMHLAIPLATGMEKVHWVKWEQIAFILYLESYSRHWVTDAPSQRKTSFLHMRQYAETVWFQWENARVFVSFKIHFSCIFQLTLCNNNTMPWSVCFLPFRWAFEALVKRVLVHSSVWTWAQIFPYRWLSDVNAKYCSLNTFMKLLMCWHVTNISVFARECEYIHRKPGEDISWRMNILKGSFDLQKCNFDTGGVHLLLLENHFVPFRALRSFISCWKALQSVVRVDFLHWFIPLLRAFNQAATSRLRL